SSRRATNCSSSSASPRSPSPAAPARALTQRRTPGNSRLAISHPPNRPERPSERRRPKVGGYTFTGPGEASSASVCRPSPPAAMFTFQGNRSPPCWERISGGIAGGLRPGSVPGAQFVSPPGGNRGNELSCRNYRSVNDLGKFVSTTPQTPFLGEVSRRGGRGVCQRP